MRQIAERLRQRPAGTVLVEKRWWNRQMADSRRSPQDPDKSAADPSAYTDLYRVHQIRQATDVEVFVGFETLLMRRRAINRRRSISRGRQPAGRSQKFAQCVAERRGRFHPAAFVSGDITPAHNRQGFALQFSSTMRRAAAASSGSLFRKSTRQRSFLLNASRAPAQRCEKAIRFL